MSLSVCNNMEYERMIVMMVMVTTEEEGETNAEPCCGEHRDNERTAKSEMHL